MAELGVQMQFWVPTLISLRATIPMRVIWLGACYYFVIPVIFDIPHFLSILPVLQTPSICQYSKPHQFCWFSEPHPILSILLAPSILYVLRAQKFHKFIFILGAL